MNFCNCSRSTEATLSRLLKPRYFDYHRCFSGISIPCDSFPRDRVFTARPTDSEHRCFAGLKSDRSNIPAEPRSLEKKRAGAIHIIFGPMFAGKTTTLLRQVVRAESDGLTVLLVKSEVDVRYSTDKIASHNGGANRSCIPVTMLNELTDILSKEQLADIDVIAIDEAQFLSDLMDFCVTMAEKQGKQIFVAGLDGDFCRAQFGKVNDLIPLCDTVTKLTTRCSLCAVRPALFSARWSNQNNQVLVGGTEVYTPVCRGCYRVLL